MMLSATSQYALRALSALARLPDGGPASAAQLAQASGAPPNYLSKLLKQLAHAGVLTSQKGLGGGFTLARPAAALTLAEIVSPLENLSRLATCLLGPQACDEHQPCPAHHRWQAVRDSLTHFLATTTLAEMAGQSPVAAAQRSSTKH